MVVLFLNIDPCPNPELWPNTDGVLWLNSPVLLGVLELLVPKEKELALVTVGAPKRPPPPVVALLELAPNADWVNEKPLEVPPMLAGCPNPPTPNTDLPKPVSVGAPNPDEPNPVVAGAEEAGGAAGCPNTLAAVVAALVITAAVVVVGAAVLMAGMAPTELLVVVAGVAEVKMEPGFSEEEAGKAAEVTSMVSGTAVVDVETAGVEEGSGVASSVEEAVGGAGGRVVSVSAGTVEEESAVGTGVTIGSVGAADVGVVVVATAVTRGSGSAGTLARSTASSLVLSSGKAADVLSEGC